MPRKTFTAKTAAAIGPSSHTVEANGIVALSGQTPLDPKTGQLVRSRITAETNQCLDNLFAVLDTAGLTTDDVINCQVYLTNMDDFAEMNAAYIKGYSTPLPARTTIAVASPPISARVQIGLMAVRPKT
jgi:2-iminobutanoate/2-iminopropanoate deaminase